MAAIARTINELALEKVYRPLGFKVYDQFRDTPLARLAAFHFLARRFRLIETWPCAAGPASQFRLSAQ